MCALGGWATVGTINHMNDPKALQKLVLDSSSLMSSADKTIAHDILHTILEIVFNKFQMFRPWRSKQQNPLEILHSPTVAVKYGNLRNRTEEAYRLDVRMENKVRCIVVPYGCAGKASKRDTQAAVPSGATATSKEHPVDPRKMCSCRGILMDTTPGKISNPPTKPDPTQSSHHHVANMAAHCDELGVCTLTWTRILPRYLVQCAI